MVWNKENQYSDMNATENDIFQDAVIGWPAYQADNQATRDTNWENPDVDPKVGSDSLAADMNKLRAQLADILDGNWFDKFAGNLGNIGAYDAIFADGTAGTEVGGVATEFIVSDAATWTDELNGGNVTATFDADQEDFIEVHLNNRRLVRGATQDYTLDNATEKITINTINIDTIADRVLVISRGKKGLSIT